MAAVRTATVTWNGDLTSGEGTVSAGTSQLFSDLPVSWASRTEEADGRTSPEELLAAAHASCFAMAFSAQLARNGTPPQELHVEAEVTFDKVGEAWSVISSRLIVVGQVDGISDADFDALADAAKDGCPISRALNENVEISVEPTLEH
ncbi:MAG TPA: OsmC family peroxiredoxin [Candidatus Limnocylindria bacterium]|jgi:osmotically inducible protein OsmC